MGQNPPFEANAGILLSHRSSANIATTPLSLLSVRWHLMGNQRCTRKSLPHTQSVISRPGKFETVQSPHLSEFCILYTIPSLVLMNMQVVTQYTQANCSPT